MIKTFRSGRVMPAKNKIKKGCFSKRFRCGRVMINKDGVVKKVGLGQGGGSRYCKWYHKWMNFNDVHRQLVKIFDLNENEDEILLYDFQLRPLDINQYQTVFKYVNDNGLSCNGTVLYLCTRPANDNNQSQKVSTTSNEHVVKTESNMNLQKDYLNYSFKNTINDLIKNIRHLLIEDTVNEILIQLFESSCILYGYICSTIHPIQQHQNFQLIHQSEHLNDIIDICKSMKTLMNINKEKLHQIENFSLIKKIFTQFYRHLKFWFDHGKNIDTSNSNQDQNTINSHQQQSEDNHIIPYKKIKLEKQDNHDHHHRQMDIATYSSLNI